jgi:hypothetical protein
MMYELGTKKATIGEGCMSVGSRNNFKTVGGAGVGVGLLRSSPDRVLWSLLFF